MLILKKKKETDKELAHTDVYKDKLFLGYFIRNKSLGAVVNENWNFVNKSNLDYFHTRTKQEMITQLELRTQ